jgi:hypothetical protein
MPGPRSAAATLFVLFAIACPQGLLLAGVHAFQKSPKNILRPAAPRAPAEADGGILAALTDEGLRRARDLLGAGGPEGDGSGASVEGLQVYQTLYLDSACGFPAKCQGPCNEVTMAWTETNRNTDGVELKVDGVSWGIIPGRVTVPGLNGATLSPLPAGVHVFRAEDITGGTSAELTFTVLAGQPFDDPAQLQCAPAGSAGGGKCRMAVTWEYGSPSPDRYDVFIDGVYAAALQGQETGYFRDVLPGQHTVTVQALTVDTRETFHLGCTAETTCNIACSDGACDPPVLVRVCQAAYSSEDKNAVRVEWLNGESPYGVGIDSFVDGAHWGREETDPSTGSPTVSALTGLTVGQHQIGIQGVCVDPSLVSATARETVTILAASPHTSPIVGDLQCSFEQASSTTTVTWVTGTPSLFIDVFLRSDDGLRYLGTFPGEANVANFHGLSADTVLAFQFFANFEGGCYGSEIIDISCAPQGAKKYIAGLCNGVGNEIGKPVITSAVYGLSFLFTGGPAPPCRKACDANGDGTFDISDMVYVLMYLFLGGPAPRTWQDWNEDGALDPTCIAAEPEDDCATGHAYCAQ